jgi:hypothetical protein
MVNYVVFVGEGISYETAHAAIDRQHCPKSERTARENVPIHI